jgi:hypothetical protein
MAKVLLRVAIDQPGSELVCHRGYVVVNRGKFADAVIAESTVDWESDSSVQVGCHHSRIRGSRRQ